jgi:hypothetical protein
VVLVVLEDGSEAVPDGSVGRTVGATTQRFLAALGHAWKMG